MMATPPLVSIITVTKNRAGFLKRNIQSILEQSYPLLEHIVVDGASSDDSLRVIKEYETAYRLRWISEPDKNHAEAYNKGIKLSKGSIVGFLNSDDEYLPGTVQAVVDAFSREPVPDIVYGNILFVYDDSTERIKRFDTTNARKMLYHTGFLPQQTLFYSRNILERTGLMNDALIWVPENEWWLRMFKLHPRITYVDQVFTKASLHKGSISILRAKEQLRETTKIHLFKDPWHFPIYFWNRPLKSAAWRFVHNFLHNLALRE